MKKNGFNKTEFETKKCKTTGSTKLNSKTKMQTFSGTHLGRRRVSCALKLGFSWVGIHLKKKKTFYLFILCPDMVWPRPISIGKVHMNVFNKRRFQIFIYFLIYH